MRSVKQLCIRQFLGRSSAIIVLCLSLAACGGSGGGGSNPPPPPPPPAPPTALSYAGPATLVAGTATVPRLPTVTGNVTAYSVSPALPPGLTLDATSGLISGTPTTVAAQASFTITATNNVGSTTFDLLITINPPAPSGLTYDNPQRVFARVAVTLTAAVTGTVDTYSVSPPLPAGLTIDAVSGRISGTPTTVGASANYTATASNVTGATSVALPIQVTSFVVEARAEVDAVDLQWPTGSNASYTLFRAEAASCDIVNYASCAGGTLVANVTPPYRATGLQNGTSYWFRLEAKTSGAILSNEASARPDQLTAQQVLAIATAADGTAYLGGEFRSVGVRTGGGVPLDATTGLPGAFPFVDGTVFAVVPDGAGGWYIGGDFLSVGGLPRTRLARIRADMTVDAWSPSVGEPRPLSGQVEALALVGDTLYVGGIFSSVNGVPRSGLAAIGTDAVGTLRALDATFDSPFGVSRLAVSGDTIFIGGDFQAVNGQPRARLAALERSTGTLRSWNPGADNYVRGIAVANDVVYVGGTFTMLGGEPRNFVGAVGAVDGVARAWNPAPSAYLNSLTIDGDVVYITGGFTQVAGQTRVAAAAVGTDGVLRAWNPGLPAAENITVAGDIVYMTGQFSAAGFAARTGLAAVGKDGVLRDWNPAPDGWPRAIAVAGDKVYVGGYLNHFRGTARTRLAAIRPDGTLDAWAPQTNGQVNALALAGDTVFAGGAFSSGKAENQPSQTRNRLAAFGTDGALRDWNPDASGIVKALVADNGVVYAGGEFTTIGGVSRRYAAAIGTNGVLDANWKPDPDDIVRTLAVAGDAVFVGGDFTQLGGQPRARLGLVDTDGALRGWSVGFDGPVSDGDDRGHYRLCREASSISRPFRTSDKRSRPSI